MTHCKFTTSLITDKGNQVRGLIHFETLVALAECPDEIDNNHLGMYQLIKNNKVNSDQLSHNIRLTQSNGWANSAGLKCSIDKLQSDYLGTKTRNGQEITTEVIQSLKEQEKQGFYSLLFADIDQCNLSMEAVKARIDYFIHKIKQQKDNACYLIYSTKSSLPNNKKYRVVIPLQGVINTKEFIITQAFLCKVLGGDIATTKPFQAFMLPLAYNNDYIPKTDYGFFFHEFKGKFLHAVEIKESITVLKLMERDAQKLEQRVNSFIPRAKLCHEPLVDESIKSLPALFNAQADLLAILQRNGYRIVKDRGNKIEIALPGKTESKGNAHVYRDTNTFHTFNSNDILYNGSRSLKAYEVIKRLEFNNDDKEVYRVIANSKEHLEINGMTYNDYRKSLNDVSSSNHKGARTCILKTPNHSTNQTMKRIEIL